MRDSDPARTGWHEPRRLLFLRALFEADETGTFLNAPFLRSMAQEGDVRLDEVAGDIEDRIQRRHTIEFRLYYAPIVSRFLPYVGLPCFLIGLFSNYLGPGGEVNLLLNPFIILLFWNLLVYAWLVVPKRKQKDFPGSSIVERLILWLQDWWYRKLMDYAERTPKTAILARARFVFQRLWLRHYRPVVHGRITGAIHLIAGTIVLGVIAGMYLRGLVQEYRFSWSSTFIQDVETLRALLAVLFAPVLFLAKPFLPGGLPSVDGGGSAWIHLFAFTALLYIAVPRGILAYFSFRRARTFLTDERPTLDDVYFRKVAALLRRQRSGLTLIDYSYSPSSDSNTLIVNALREVVGGEIDLLQSINLEWGETDTDIRAGQAGLQSIWVVRFNGAQTPEGEVHRLFAANLLSMAADRDVRLIALVDAQRVPGEGVSSRGELWQEILPPALPFVWIDCGSATRDDMVEALGEALA